MSTPLAMHPISVIRTPEQMRAHADTIRSASRTHALVPTMGSLHAGHLALVREAREVCDHVTVSIFVNPSQFGAGEDYSTYPRDFKADYACLERTGGVDAIFAPTWSDMYPGGPDGQVIWVDSPAMTTTLCGPHRPGHFRGVLTVVAKLLTSCVPDVAVFGLKDAQQYILVKRLVQDLGFRTRVVGVPTVRDADGLAYSSRNANLSRAERAQSGALFRAVENARALIEDGERCTTAITESMKQTLATASLATLQYAELVFVRTLEPVQRMQPGDELLAAVAVYFGSTRLIDNAIVVVPAT